MIEKRTLQNGRRVFRVRWRDAGRGSREHVRSFDRHEDAVRFETDIRRRRQLGELAALDQGRETLDEWAREWFRTYAQPNLAGHTLVYYARAWDKHVLSRLGGVELRRITPAVVADFAGTSVAASADEDVIVSLNEDPSRDRIEIRPRKARAERTAKIA